MRRRRRTNRRATRRPFVKQPRRIPRDVLLNTVQIGPALETGAIAFAAKELLMNMYAIDAMIYPFGRSSKYQLRVYSGLDMFDRRYAEFFVTQLQDLFTWPARRRLMRGGPV